MGEDRTLSAGNSILVGADIQIGRLPFQLTYQYMEKDSALRIEWKNSEMKALGVDGLSDLFESSPVKFEVPTLLKDFDLAITKVVLAYYFKKNAFRFILETAPYGSFSIETFMENKERVLRFLLQLNACFLLKNLPVLGDGLGGEDSISLDEFRVVSRQGKIGVGAEVGLVLMGNKKVCFDVSTGNDSSPDFSAAEDGAVHWIDVGKYAGPLHIARLGFEMGGDAVTLYVDAGLSLSVLLLEFLGLYLSIPLKSGGKTEYGMSGMAVSLSRPPLSLSGGLYLSKEAGMELYNGEAALQFKSFGATVLCSYGQFSDGLSSLFGYLMIDFAFGGPPVFYVTGLAGGFGYNRGIALPSRIQDVEQFPFVAAAMGKGSLKPDMTPAGVLVEMNQYIKPCKGQYFFSLGIRFTSFGIVESFALLNMEFGVKLRLSMLGISKLSLPPGSSEPFAYAQLALKLVLAPDDGVVSVEGALSSESYLLDKNCKLHGGFALFVWFGKNEHAGDFVITLGGYRSGFYVPHYPAADRLGVNWKMGNNLTLDADFYFALTPSCIMMGGNMSLTYEWGRIKAWFRVWAEFFMQWKPFLYECSVGVNIGASFRWDFFPFYKTFSVELGAELKLWGPPFGGEVHISWFVISLTIRMGSRHPTVELLDWITFADEFLKDSSEANEKERDLIAIHALEGVVRQSKGGTPVLLDCAHLLIEITTQMMCTQVKSGEKTLASCGDLGILPMGISSFNSVLTARISGAEETDFLVEVIENNAPRAVWNQTAPSPDSTDMLKSGVPSGLFITCEEKAPDQVLPIQGYYDMQVLCRNERLTPHAYAWTTPEPILPKEYPGEDRLKQIEETIGKMGGERSRILAALSADFGVYSEEELKLEHWSADLDELLYAEPVLQKIGAEQEE